MSNLERAIELATLAHRGQVDKAGRPYILHPLELMSRFADADADAKIVAVLHDTIEDSDLDAAALRAKGFSEPVVDAVLALTRRSHESYDEFIERVRTNPLARRVKIADLEHNMDVRRLAKLGPDDLERLERYHRSWRRLARET